MTEKQCPLCESVGVEKLGIEDLSLTHRINCNGCGRFEITNEAELALPHYKDLDSDFLPKLTHHLCKMEKAGRFPLIDVKTLEFLKNSSLPRPREQEESLILYLGQQTRPGKKLLQLNAHDFSAFIGSYDEDEALFILNSLKEQDYITGNQIMGGGLLNVGLTIQGWDCYESLNKGVSQSQRAFMAMEFTDEMFNLFPSFQQSVAETGFELKVVEARPGLIDDHIRVDIRNARFVIADLTNGNRGAYWEAGYAEGLGKKVIYTCEKEYFKKTKTHFDTNHCRTVKWSAGSIQSDLNELKDIIRYEFPEATPEETSVQEREFALSR